VAVALVVEQRTVPQLEGGVDPHRFPAQLLKSCAIEGLAVYKHLPCRWPVPAVEFKIYALGI